MHFKNPKNIFAIKEKCIKMVGIELARIYRLG